MVNKYLYVEMGRKVVFIIIWVVDKDCYGLISNFVSNECSLFIFFIRRGYL